jgi:hypothetical protein
MGFDMLKSKGLCMDWVPSALSVISRGVHSTWWGISCPSHGFGTGIPSLLAALHLGLSTGILVGFAICAWLLGLFPGQSPRAAQDISLGHPSSRIRAYLDEPEAIVFQPRQRRN